MNWKSLGLALCAMVLSAAAPALAKPPVVGKPAPEFSATLLDGRRVTLADFKGQVLIVNFWATWCAPCKKELPLLDTYFKVQRRHGLSVIAVTTEDSLPLSQLKPLAAALTIPMVRSFRGPYGTPDGYPTNYVIDRAGVVRYAAAGAFDLDTLNTLLVPLLREPPPEAPATVQPVAAVVSR
jgi:cytochrome c biogenesis protein CcmG/thiol:disulfide interchange protein DsbE